MNINFQKAQDQFNLVIDKLGTEIEFLQRVTSGSDIFDTGSLVTYGYGNLTNFWVTGSLKALISKPTANEIVMEPGHFEDEYMQIKVRYDSPIEYWDQVIIPSGSSIKYIILPVQYWIVGPITIYKFANIRRLVPASGSTY